MVLKSKIAYSCLADLQNRALVRYTLQCDVIIHIAGYGRQHCRVFLKSGRRLPRFLIFVEMFLSLFSFFIPGL